MTWTDHLDRWGGAASGRQLRAAGASARDLTAAVTSGALVRPRNGRYARAGADAAILSALGAGGRLSCVSAAKSYGLWSGSDARTHMVVPPHTGRSEPGGAGIVRHWRTCDDHPEIWRVSVADCLRTVARCADPETAIAVLDTALSSGRLTPHGLRRVFEGEPASSRRLAARARPGSDSGVESLFRQRLSARGHRVEQQLHVAGVGRVDARVDGVLYVEIDGFAFHRDRASFERDRARDTAMALRGMRRLRLSARQVLDDPAGVVETVEAVLAVLGREEDRVAKAG